MTFKKLFETREGKLSVMPYLCAGDYGVAFTHSLALNLAKAGAHAFEIGFPYSDPVADGVTLQRAHSRALANKTTPPKVFALTKSLKKTLQQPIALMAYYNTIHTFGVKKFVKATFDSRAQAILCPDLPLEESSELREYCTDYAIEFPRFIAPNTPLARARQIASQATGFIYLVTSYGVTGERKKLSVKNKALELREITGLPLVAGFGISNRMHLKQLQAAHVNGAIIGSALANAYAPLAETNPRRAVKNASNYLQSLLKTS